MVQLILGKDKEKWGIASRRAPVPDERRKSLTMYHEIVRVQPQRIKEQITNDDALHYLCFPDQERANNTVIIMSVRGT